MGTDIANLDAFKGHAPSTVFASLDPTKESLADGIGSSYGVLGYRGKVWSLRYRGEKHNFVRPDDGTPISYIDVVVLHDPGVKSKSFYQEGFDEGGSDGKRPTCASLNGITPDADVVVKQADACAICPRNVWKTDANGKKSRECSDYKRLAVLVLPKQTHLALGSPLIEPVFLRIPPASLNDLALVGETMAKQGFHYSTFSLRISFEPDKAHPQFVYRPLQALSDAEAKVVMQLRADPLTLRITGDGVPDAQFTALPAQTAQPVANKPAETPPVQPVQVVQAESTKVQATVPVQAVNTPATVDPKPVIEDQGGAFGLGDLPAATPAKPAVVAAKPEVVDATFEEADANIDEKLRNLLKV